MTDNNIRLFPFQDPTLIQDNKPTLETSIEEMNSLILGSQTSEPLCFSEEELMRGYQKMVSGEITFMRDHSINSFYKGLKDNEYKEYS